MKVKTKKWMTSGLVLVAVAIWVPQLLVGVVQPASSKDVRSDSAKGVERPLREPAAPRSAQVGASAVSAASSPGVHAEPESLSGAVASATERLQRHASTAHRVDLTALLANLHLPGASETTTERAARGRSSRSPRVRDRR